MFRVFLSFCIFAGADICQLSTSTVLSFLEFLALSKLSLSVILNYISAIKTKFSILALDVSPFSDPRIKYFHRSLLLHRPFKVAIKSIIDPSTLKSMVKECDHMFMGPVYKAAYLLSFFLFLRITNLVPHSMEGYDPLQQLARADIIFATPGAHVTKTLQNNNSVRILKIPHLGTSPLCPVKALKSLLRLAPGSNNSPLFQVQYQGSWVPLTDTRLRKNFSQILKNLHLSGSNITFHSLRRSGASLAFNSHVPLQNIQSHGTWTSECVWSYITQDHNASDQMALAFQSQLKQ